MTAASILKKTRLAAKRMLRPLLALPPVRNRLCLVHYVLPQDGVVRLWDDPAPQKTTIRSKAINKLRVLAPEQEVQIASPAIDSFVPVGKYFRSGSFTRPPTFVCDLPDAVLHVGSGLVCTRDMEVVADLEYRLPCYGHFRGLKPRRTKKCAGLYSSINYCVANNLSHWMLDCLPRIHSLAKAEPGAKVTLIMPEGLGVVQRESLMAVLPSNFVVEYFPDNAWLQLETFLWPSLVSGQANFLLPSEYYAAIRDAVFSRLNLPLHPLKTGRIYISRRRAQIRRVVNEEQVCGLLAAHGFECVELEGLSFRQQVELFHRAEIVVGAHGAGLVWMLFAGNIRLVELHPGQQPRNHYHTLARGLGQEYHFLLHNEGEDDNFTVDLKRLKELLKSELGLRPAAAELAGSV